MKRRKAKLEVLPLSEADRIRKRYKRLACDPNKMWPMVQKALFKMAWKTTKRYDVAFEDARSEVYYAFMKACWRYRPDKDAEFLSFCCFLANCRLTSLVMRRSEQRRRMPTVEINEETAGYAPAVHSPCLDIIEDLSEDARALVHLLLEIPEDLVGKRMSPRQLMMQIKRYMVTKLGKDKRTVEKAHRELVMRFWTEEVFAA